VMYLAVLGAFAEWDTIPMDILPVSCEQGNCDWGTFTSAGLCSTCEDWTGKTESTCETLPRGRSTNPSSQECTHTLTGIPSKLSIGRTAPDAHFIVPVDFGKHSANASHETGSFSPANGFAIFQGTQNITLCGFYPCLRTYTEA